MCGAKESQKKKAGQQALAQAIWKQLSIVNTQMFETLAAA